MLKLGPKLMDGSGSPWDEGGNTEIRQILISYDQNTIKSIQFVYAETPTGVRLSQVYGEPTGSNFNSVIFDYPSEFLTSLSGMYYDEFGEFGIDILAMITFGTNKRKFGPFGTLTRSGWKFNYEFGERTFGGFHGTFCRSNVFSIGVYVKPVQALDTTTNNRDQKMWKLFCAKFGLLI